MQLLNPIWLWGLTALAIPIGIHLLSRKEGKTILIGSVRFLSDSPTARFRHIKLNEILLLALRCLLIILFVLLLAGLTTRSLRVRKWILVEHGTANTDNYKRLIDSAKAQGFEMRRFAEGFPLWKEDDSSNEKLNYWSLAASLDEEQLDSALVISRNFIKNFKGERIPLPDHIAWLVTDELEEDETLAKAVELSQDSLWIRKALLSSAQTDYTTDIISKQNAADTFHISRADAVTISIYHDDEFYHDAKILIAALKAIDSHVPLHFEIITTNTRPKIAPSTWQFWLSIKPFASMANNSVQFSACPDSNLPVIMPAVSASLHCNTQTANWILTKRLTEDIALRENLPIRLAEIIIPTALTEKIEDHRTISTAMAFSTGKLPKKITRERKLDAMLILSIIAILLTERIIAFRKDQ